MSISLWLLAVHPLAANVPAALRGGGFTELPAGYKRSISHKIVCGATAAISQNRPLYADLFILFQ
jgi:hypothetical protein